MTKSKRPSKKLASEAKYRHSIRGKTKRLMYYYGITYEDYCEIIGKQNGRCAICLSVPTKRNLAVDHCHTTGKIRGLLCSACNTALGKFKDLPELLERAVSYLRANGA